MERKALIISFICVSSMMFSSCRASGGIIKNVSIVEVQSKIYSEADIKSAEKVVLDYFQKGFSGCTMTELKYIGDDKNNDYLDFAERIGSSEVIVFLSNFDVDSSGDNGSLNPNSTYQRWDWILARDIDGTWKHVDHGYG